MMSNYLAAFSWSAFVTDVLIAVLIWSFFAFVILATKLAKHWTNKL